VFDRSRQQDPKWAIGVEKVSRLDDSHRHAFAVLVRDFLQPVRAVEGVGPGFLDRESGLGALGQDVDNGAESVGPVFVAEPTAEP
jgi:hypothetical protein